MGYAHERGAAVRTILRARAIGDPQVIADAEEAGSGYLDADDVEVFDQYVSHHMPDGLPRTDPVAVLLRERDHFKQAATRLEAEITNVLAKALGYPLFAPGEPGYSPDQDNYVIGDHTAETLALEAAARLRAIAR